MKANIVLSRYLILEFPIENPYKTENNKVIWNAVSVYNTCEFYL